MELTPEEVRVLGCLVEKEATTPDVYPLTLNALRSACNQSSNRDPVVAYDDRTVQGALDSLRERKLTRVVHSPSNRATKYRHVLPEALGLDEGEVALLAVLFLRGPQTLGELRTRTERLHPFGSLGELGSTLDRLADREEPLVRRLDRALGQKELRVAVCIAPPPAAPVHGAGEPSAAAAVSLAPPPAAPVHGAAPALEAAPPSLRSVDDRVAALEAEVVALRAKVAELREALGG